MFGWLLLALAALDVAEFWLPDALTGALALAGLASIAVAPPDWPDRLIGGVAGFASLWLIGFAYRRLRGREGLGGGDPKLLGAIGLWVGWAMLPFVRAARLPRRTGGGARRDGAGQAHDARPTACRSAR